ncbi:MAG: hypothetical protein JJ975_07940 [Bacteroidia bacterium]|nr:hypothetical protein [Bacteroidia bacterium]
MKHFYLLLVLVALVLCASVPAKKKYKHVITDENRSLPEMTSRSGYTVFYCWADWCGPCLRSMKSTLIETKRLTDSLGLSISYASILYAPRVSNNTKNLMANAYQHGIEVFKTGSANALTQKLQINSDFKSYEGFNKGFAVPRVLLIDSAGNMVTDHFKLNYSRHHFMDYLHKTFPNAFDTTNQTNPKQHLKLTKEN